jgi:hypothetical protein
MLLRHGDVAEPDRVIEEVLAMARGGAVHGVVF